MCLSTIFQNTPFNLISNYCSSIPQYTIHISLISILSLNSNASSQIPLYHHILPSFAILSPISYLYSIYQYHHSQLFIYSHYRLLLYSIQQHFPLYISSHNPIIILHNLHDLHQYYSYSTIHTSYILYTSSHSFQQKTSKLITLLTMCSSASLQNTSFNLISNYCSSISQYTIHISLISILSLNSNASPQTPLHYHISLYLAIPSYDPESS